MFAEGGVVFCAQVQDDIVQQLAIPTAVRLIGTFNRPNIHYSVQYVLESSRQRRPGYVHPAAFGGCGEADLEDEEEGDECEDGGKLNKLVKLLKEVTGILDKVNWG